MKIYCNFLRKGGGPACCIMGSCITFCKDSCCLVIKLILITFLFLVVPDVTLSLPILLLSLSLSPDGVHSFKCSHYNHYNHYRHYNPAVRKLWSSRQQVKQGHAFCLLPVCSARRNEQLHTLRPACSVRSSCNLLVVGYKLMCSNLRATTGQINRAFCRAKSVGWRAGHGVRGSRGVICMEPDSVSSIGMTRIIVSDNYPTLWHWLFSAEVMATDLCYAIKELWILCHKLYKTQQKKVCSISSSRKNMVKLNDERLTRSSGSYLFLNHWIIIGDAGIISSTIGTIWHQ